MTLHIWQIDFFAAVDTEQAEIVTACNRAANAWGRNGQNFTIRLSSTGVEPATHLGGSARETDLFVRAVEAAPGLLVGMTQDDWPPDLTPADWQAVANHLVMVKGPAATTNARQQFDALIAGRGLKRIVPSGG